MFRYLIIYKLIFFVFGSIALSSIHHCHEPNDSSHIVECLECQSYQINIFFESNENKEFDLNEIFIYKDERHLKKKNNTLGRPSSRAPPIQ